MNIKNNEIIGKPAKIKTPNAEFEGTIIDETKNTFTVRTEKGDKKIEKKNAKITINEKTIKGEELQKRHHQRTKLR